MSNAARKLKRNTNQALGLKHEDKKLKQKQTKARNALSLAEKAKAIEHERELEKRIEEKAKAAHLV